MTQRRFVWEKLGLIYSVSGTDPLQRSHAQIPIAELRDENRIRIYFSSRDDNNRSRIFSIDIATKAPYEVMRYCDEPILDLGPLGSFDDSGVMPTWILSAYGKKYLYYIGWNARITIPYHNSIGLAISDDNGISFEKAYSGPIIDRNKDEPYFSGTACVMLDGETWKNWYLSCTGWIQGDRLPEPLYHIKYAESIDGVNWRRDKMIAIDYKNEDEGGIVKASVIKFKDGYSMWYSYRNKLNYRSDIKDSYRIGYAESTDGIYWVRLDDSSGISLSAEGWDSNMLAYPHVLAVEDRLFMFYNGNGFGASGFGLAVAKNNYFLG